MTLADLAKLPKTCRVRVSVVVDGWGRARDFWTSAERAEKAIRDYGSRTHTIEVIYSCRLGTGVHPGKRYADYHPAQDAA